MRKKSYSIHIYEDNINTRSKRRRIVNRIRIELDRIHFAEGMYMTRIPENLQGSDAYDAAIESMDRLEEAIMALDEAYDN
jgi:hypothetical protein